ncbi:MAG TPA: methylenetetrahydrofolate reductase C-terminal domain-containing protein [Anaerolineae bacterium]|nr:methylenetetrahydrofolate reductase C-terminal domain-containing protein [Anaerolineae bacterium]
MRCRTMSVRRWIQDHPRPLEWAYRVAEKLFSVLDPLLARVGYDRVDRLIRPFERWSKGPLFGCRMCGQCVLRKTGMTCPMTCPKQLRNGPCGGVRPGGYCEVYADRRCIWTEAFERSQHMRIYGERILDVQPPVDWTLQGQSAWVNMLRHELPALRTVDRGHA